MGRGGRCRSPSEWLDGKASDLPDGRLNDLRYLPGKIVAAGGIFCDGPAGWIVIELCDHREASVQSTQLGVISDTHGDIPSTRKAVRMLESLEVGMVIHCGDVGSPEVPALFTKWPTHFVLGNVDKPGDDILSAIKQAGLVCHGRFGTLTAQERKIAFLHSDDLRCFRETVDSGDWDLVCYGHTHRADQQHVGATLVLNPGAISRAWPPTLAVVDLRRMMAHLMEIG